jgi:preprotein translocase subunit SecD
VNGEGNTVAYDANDPMYRQHLAKQQHQRKQREMQAKRIEQIRQAPKRRSGDPIYVALHPVKLGDKLKKAQHSKGAVNKQVRKEFKSDKIIRIVSKKDRKRNEWVQMGKVIDGENPYATPVADVEVVSRAYLKEIYGINKKTGKPDKMPALVLEATIKSNQLPAEYKVKETGHILRNPEVTHRFASRIKHIIKQQIGPTLPARQLGYHKSR